MSRPSDLAKRFGRAIWQSRITRKEVACGNNFLSSPVSFQNSEVLLNLEKQCRVSYHSRRSRRTQGSFLEVWRLPMRNVLRYTRVLYCTPSRDTDSWEVVCRYLRLPIELASPPSCDTFAWPGCPQAPS